MSEAVTADEHASRMLNISTSVGEDEHGEALFALAAGKRLSGESLMADFGASLLANARQSEAQLFQDLFALFVLSSKRGGYFVEVGTGDGKLISNTYLLEKSYAWRGIVVEPNPAFLPSLRANRSCCIATDCVLDVTGRSVRLSCTADPEFSFVAGVGTQVHAEAGAMPIAELTLTSIGLNDLLAREQCPREIDYISVDVEGAEFEILRTFDFAAWDVKCLTVEHNFTANRDHIHKLLRSHGYVRVFQQLSQWDDWYVQRDVLARLPGSATLVGAQDEPSLPETDPDDFVHWAIAAIGRSELAAAQALCEHALAMDPGCAAAFRTLAEVATAQQRPDAALQHWRSAVEVEPGGHWSRFGLAESLVKRGVLTEAIEHLEAATAIDADGPATPLLATLRLKLGTLARP